MKLNEIYPLTVVALRAFPNKRGKAHSGQEVVSVSGPNAKVKLKAGKKKVPLFAQEDLDEGWTNNKDGSFSADMSEIEGHQKETKQAVKCPGCRKPMNVKQLSAQHDPDEHEITSWKGSCPSCHAKLTVFND